MLTGAAVGIRVRAMPYVASVFGRVSASASRRTALIVLIFVIAANVVVDRAAHSQASPPDLIIVNARIYTVDRAFSTAQAVAIAGGKFTAVGTNDDIRRLATGSTRVLDAGGKTIIPGLADDHLHGAGGGGDGVDLSRTRTLGDVLTAIGGAVKRARPGEIVVTNADWHEAQLREQRLPYRRDLDAVAPSTPVVVVRGGHEYILNSAALKKWNITKATPVPPGGEISRDGDGELNGELMDRAKALVTLPPAPPLDEQHVIAEHRKLNAAGLTSIRYPGASAEQYRILQQMAKKGTLTIRVNQLMRAFEADSADKLKAAISSWGVRPGEGDEWLRVGGVKLAVDGGFEGGWMTQPYAGDWGRGGEYRGVNTVKQQPYTDMVVELNRQGWRVATHAVGDAAIDEVLAAYETADAEKSIVGRRWTIEHAFIPRADHFPRMKKLGLVISAQDHLYLAGPRLVKMWGRERAGWTTPMRTFLDQGFIVAGGTDSPVVPYPPLWVFYHFTTRDTISGGVLGAGQKITRREALQVETINNAYVTFEEQTKGSIEPGKLADLVVLPEDIMTCPDKAIESMQVSMTMVGGKIVYQQEGSLSAPPQ